MSEDKELKTGGTLTNNHIEEYFAKKNESDGNRAGRMLFTATKDDTDIKTELNDVEIFSFSTLKMYDKHLLECGFEPIFDMFYDDYFRLKISRNRQSRGEFVRVSSQDKSEDVMEGMRTAGTLFAGGK